MLKLIIKLEINLKSKVKIFNVFDFNKKIKSDIVISAIPGIAGLYPTIDVIKKTKKFL